MVSIPCIDPLGMGKVRRWLNQPGHVFGVAILICELKRYKVGAEPIVINGPQLPIDKAMFFGVYNSTYNWCPWLFQRNQWWNIAFLYFLWLANFNPKWSQIDPKCVGWEFLFWEVKELLVLLNSFFSWCHQGDIRRKAWISSWPSLWHICLLFFYRPWQVEEGIPHNPQSPFGLVFLLLKFVPLKANN